MDSTEGPVDLVTQRREMRRRKILENAKSRLERLNGRNSGIDQKVAPVTPHLPQNSDFSDPEVEPDLITRREAAPPLLPPQMAFPPELSELFNTLGAGGLGGGETAEVQPKHYLLLSRAHILLAAVISYIVSMWRWQTAESSEDGIGFSVFLPFGLMIVLELIFYRSQQKLNPITQLIITMSGIHTQRAKKLLHFFTTIQSLVVDLGIFVFVFCNFTFLLTCVNHSFVHLVTIK